MKTYQVTMEQADHRWLAAHTVEEESVHTQGRTLDEVAANIREVADLLHGERDILVELSAPSSVTLAAEHA